MTRDLDEMGKERTMKWCTYSGNGCYKYPRQYASDCLDCPYFKECIPVEPERVWRCPSPDDRCPYPGTPCDRCAWNPSRKFPSPGLLQRMGMTWRFCYSPAYREWDWEPIYSREEREAYISFNVCPSCGYYAKH